MTRRMPAGAQIAFTRSWLERQGIEAQTIDVEAYIDPSLSYEENIKLFKREFKLGGGRSRKRATRDLSIAECDVAIGNYEAGFNHEVTVDACACGHPDACVDLERAKRGAKPKKKGKTMKQNITLIEQWTKGEDSYYGAETVTGKTYKNLTLAQAQKIIRNKPNTYIEYDIYVGGERVMLWSEAGRPFRVGAPYETQPPRTPAAKPAAKPKKVVAKTMKAKAKKPEPSVGGDALASLLSGLLEIQTKKPIDEATLKPPRPIKIIEGDIKKLRKKAFKYAKGSQAFRDGVMDSELRRMKDKGASLVEELERAKKLPRTPAPSVPVILTPAPAAASDMASVPVRLGGGGIPPIPGMGAAAAPKPKRKTAAKPAAKPRAKKAATPKPKSKAKKPATGITLTAAQKKRLAAKGSITIKRDGKFVTVRG